MVITLIILVLAVISFLMEKIPVNLTIMLTMAALVAFGIVRQRDSKFFAMHPDEFLPLFRAGIFRNLRPVLNKNIVI